MNLCFHTLIIILVASTVICENKYSRSANEKLEKKKDKDVNFRNLEKPFRMNKLNLLWIKAQQRLTEPKLKSLYSDLMIHDKEEITYKRVKNEGGDKEGLKEAALRRKLTSILTSYGLREHFDDYVPKKTKEHAAYNSADEDHINKSLFKDKKLNMLWAKAETSGFTSEELAALREEFHHHQEKIDQYYDLLTDLDAGKKDEYKNAINQEEMERFNEVGDAGADAEEEEAGGQAGGEAYRRSANQLRDSHRGLWDGLDRLQRVVAKGPHNKEFIEPKVQGLWKLAVAANFTVDELASLKVEMQHYETRLLKLRTLHADHVSQTDRTAAKLAAAGDKLDAFDQQQQLIKKHSRKVERMHEDLETRILARHTDL